MHFENCKLEAMPTAPDPSRGLWARFARIEMEHRRFESRPVISKDDILNLTITLATSKDVLDVINA